MNCCSLTNILMGTIYLFAGKFSYIVLNKVVHEKVVEMSTKRRQCRNNPDVFCYPCGEYIMVKYQFNARDFIKRAYEAYFGMKLGNQNKSWEPKTKPSLGNPKSANIVKRNAALSDPRQSQFDVVWSSYGMV